MLANLIVILNPKTDNVSNTAHFFGAACTIVKWSVCTLPKCTKLHTSCTAWNSC